MSDANPRVASYVSSAGRAGPGRRIRRAGRAPCLRQSAAGRVVRVYQRRSCWRCRACSTWWSLAIGRRSTARLRERIEGDQPTSTHVMQGLRRDGSVVELEVYSTRTEHDGRPAVTGTMIDATERRERERALLAREQRLRDLIENAADVVYTCDLEGRITSLNRAGQRLTGYSAAEAATMRVADFVTGAQRELVDELIQRQVRERQDRHRRVRGRHATRRAPGARSEHVSDPARRRAGGDSGHRARHHRAQGAGTGAAQPDDHRRPDEAVQPPWIPHAGRAAPEAGGAEEDRRLPAVRRSRRPEDHQRHVRAPRRRSRAHRRGRHPAHQLPQRRHHRAPRRRRVHGVSHRGGGRERRRS